MTNKFKGLARWSETRRTTVFSRTQFEGQVWPRVRKTLKQISGNNEDISSNQRRELPCRCKVLKTRQIKFGILPCVKTTSLRPDVFWKKVFLQTCWGWWKAKQKVKERWCERISCIREVVYTIGLYVSRFLSEKIFSTWKGKNWDQETPSNFPRAPGTK